MLPNYRVKLMQIVYIGIFLLKDFSNACNLVAVNECTEILSRNSETSVVTDGISAIPTVGQLKKLCGAMGEFKACYTPKAAECKGDVVFSMTFGTIENTIEYLCVEGYKDILQYASCWNQTAVIKDSTRCQQAQNTMINTLHSHQKAGLLDGPTMRVKWCEVLENTTSCMRRAVEKICGEAPGCIMHTMMSRALKGLSGLMKCPAPSPCNKHSDGTIHTHGDDHSDHGIDNVSGETTEIPGNPNSGDGIAVPENTGDRGRAQYTTPSISSTILSPLAILFSFYLMNVLY